MSGVEKTVAEFVAQELGLGLGTDVWLERLPEGEDYGVWFRVLREKFKWGQLVETEIGIYVCKAGYAEARDLADQIRGVLGSEVGLEFGGWCVDGEIDVVNYGESQEGDCLVGVIVRVFRDGS